MASHYFFFSSRRRHTSWPRDWSSDVCSSDLGGLPGGLGPAAGDPRRGRRGRSEERRVGKGENDRRRTGRRGKTAGKEASATGKTDQRHEWQIRHAERSCWKRSGRGSGDRLTT